MKKYYTILFLLFLLFAMTGCQSEYEDNDYCYLNYTDLDGIQKRDRLSETELYNITYQDIEDGYEMNVYFDVDYKIGFSLSDCHSGNEAYGVLTLAEYNIDVLRHSGFNVEVTDYFSVEGNFVYVTSDNRIIVFFNKYSDEDIILEYTEYFDLDDDEHIIDVSYAKEYLYLLTSSGGLYRISGSPNVIDIADASRNDSMVTLVDTNVKSITYRYGNYLDYLTNDNDIYLYSPKPDEFVLFTDVLVNIIDEDIDEFIMEDGIYFTNTEGELFYINNQYRSFESDLSTDWWKESDEAFTIQKVDDSNVSDDYDTSTSIRTYTITDDTYLTKRDTNTDEQTSISIYSLLPEDNIVIKDVKFVCHVLFASVEDRPEEEYIYLLVITENNELYLSNVFTSSSSLFEINFSKTDIDISDQVDIKAINSSFYNSRGLYILLDNGEVIEFEFDSMDRVLNTKIIKPTDITINSFTYNINTVKTIIADLSDEYGLENLYEDENFLIVTNTTEWVTNLEDLLLYYRDYE